MAISISHQPLESSTMKLPQHEHLQQATTAVVSSHPKAALVDQIIRMHPNDLMDHLLGSRTVWKKLPSKRQNTTSHSYQNVNTCSLYDTEIVAAVRSCNLDRLQQLLDQHGPSVFFGANKNGETLLHLACRRANLATLQFLVETVQLDVHATDAMGRTILHDIMWRPRMQVRLVEYLLLGRGAYQQKEHDGSSALSPLALLAKDVRGHTPLDYCRSSDWPRWNKFWIQHRALLRKQMGACAA